MSIHVVLIQPSEPFGKNAIIPQSLLDLAAILKDASISVEIIDARLDNLTSSQTIDLLKNIDFDVVGITGLNNAYRYIKDFCFEFKREFPEKPLIAGGHFIMSIPELILRKVPIDVACTGEGDEIIVELVTRLVEGKSLDGIHNIAYLKDGALVKTEFKLVKDLDKNPLPAYELLRMEKYIENCDKLGGFYITTGRGCVNHCYYCGSMYNKVRKLSPDRLIQIFDQLNQNYGVKTFLFSEENSYFPQTWLVDICNKLNEMGRKYNLNVAGCADHVTEDICKALSSIKGKATAMIAVEHWNPDIQKKLYRAHQSKKIEQAFNLFKKYNIPITEFSILWGHPDDTVESFKETFVKSLKVMNKYSIQSLSLNSFYAIPNSSYLKDGLTQGKVKDYEDFMYATTGYAPFLNLSKYDDDIYRKFLTELWLKKGVHFSSTFFNKCKFLAASVVFKCLFPFLKYKFQTIRKIIERIFSLTMYDPDEKYYQKLACFEEVLELPPNARALVSYTHSRENMNKIFNSFREANIDLIGFIGDDTELNKLYEYPVVALENISDLNPSHILLFSGSETIKKTSVQQYCPEVEVIYINSDNKFKIYPRGLNVWFSLEQSKIFDV